MADIRYVNFGLAYTVGQTVYMNKRLQAHKALHDRILSHELEHVNGADYTLDWKLTSDWELDDFVWSNPSTWTMFLPFWYADGKLLYSKTNLILLSLGLMILTIGVIFYLWLASVL